MRWLDGITDSMDTAWIVLADIMLREECQADKDKYHDLLHIQNLKIKTNKIKQKQIHRYREETGGPQRERSRGMNEIGKKD